MPILTTGAEAAERISEENRASGTYRVPQLVIKDGESFALHFITEVTELVSLDVHSFIATKPKPDDWPGDKWPKSMWAVCQRDRAFRLRDADGRLLDGYEDGYGDCYIHNSLQGQVDEKYGGDMSKPGSQVFGLAVLRKPVTDPASHNIIGFTDETVEFKDPDGKICQIPKLVYVSQKFSNFWHPVKATSFLPPYTILDKDYIAARKGNEYTVSVVTQTPDLKPGTPAWARYEEALKLTQFSLAEFLLEHATPDHYARFFIPGAVPSGGYGKKGPGGKDDEDSSASPAAGPSATAGSAAVDPGVMAEFQKSLAARGNKG